MEYDPNFLVAALSFIIHTHRSHSRVCSSLMFTWGEVILSEGLYKHIGASHLGAKNKGPHSYFKS